MIELSHFDEHLKSLKSEDWSKLFNLFDQMHMDRNFWEIIEPEKLPDGTHTFPYYRETAVVDRFVHTCYELNIIPKFDWTVWTEGSDILNNTQQNYRDLDTVTLCKLITLVIRADRFNEGYLISCFEKGIFQKMVAALKDNIYPE
jgi:hypothetical protein